MKIERRFTKAGDGPYADITWETRKSEIRNPDGRLIFSQDVVIVPTFWSQIAADIIAQKYFRKAGVPKDKALAWQEWATLGKGPGRKPDPGRKLPEDDGEHDARQVFHRLAFTWMSWGKKSGYFDTDEDAQAFYDETCYMLARQMAAPNSPQWFNTGLNSVYGIDGPAQGHYFLDPADGKLKKSESAYARPQPHACQPWHAPISTPKGPVLIGEIVEKGLVGLEVYDGTQSGSGTTRVVAVKDNGEKPVFRVVLKNGVFVDATEDHLVWARQERRTEGNWVRVDQLRPGMRMDLSTSTTVGIPANGVGKDAKKEDEQKETDEAFLAGWIHGDGFAGQYDEGSNRSLTLEFMSVNDDEFDALVERIERVFPQVHYKVRSVESEDPDLDIKRIRLYGEVLRPFVEKFELLRNGHEIDIPQAIRTSSARGQQTYLSALFQADGTVRLRRRTSTTSDVVLTTVSRKHAADVQTLLLNHGIYSRVSAGSDKRENRRTPWQVSVGYGAARERFRDLIGFVSEEKREKLDKACSSSFPGKRIPALREESIVRVEMLGPMRVYDIQTESTRYLCNNVVVHNCFILSVEDDLVNERGIMDLITREARLFKYGSGTGSNFSKIRAANEHLSGGGVSSGLLSFLRIADRSASAIKSGGTTRRAAKMVTLDVDHPDVEKYIDWKAEEEHKVASMATGSAIVKKHLDAVKKALASFRGPEADRFDVTRNHELATALRSALRDQIPPTYLYQLLRMLEQGDKSVNPAVFTTAWDDEAYNTVSGQSSNNSLRVDDGFMKAIIDDGTWDLTGRVTGRFQRKIQARELWDRIARAAWQCADPGLQYHTTINDWHTCPAGGQIRASNPCSEYMFLDDTACNLASINLLTLYDAGSKHFDVDGYLHAIRIWTTILEISVVMAQFPSPDIARLSYEYRTLGLGYANLGSLLMVMGLAYDSAEGRAAAGALSAQLSGESYAQSARMAAQFGPFARYKENRETMLRVVRNHRRAAYAVAHQEYENLHTVPVAIDPKACPPYLLEAAKASWDSAVELGTKHGYRNAQVTAIAPTGTIGLLMDCDTTGVEPDFALVKFKKLAGGGYFKIINQSVPPALAALGYSDDQIEEIIAFATGRKTLKGAPGVSYESLEAKGFTKEALTAIEGALESAFSLEGVFSPWLIGKDFVEKALKVPESTWSLSGFSLLRHLGYSVAEIEEAERWACGTMGVEGAPVLKPEHLAVFDTATPSGKYGTRSIAWQAHIGMMAAVQPFISGAISKTINMPNLATYEDVKGAYMLAWRSAIKAVALYRDGSKLSQPLSSFAPGTDPLADALLQLQKDLDAPDAPGVWVSDSGGKPAGSKASAELRGVRRSLPNRRAGYTQKAKIGGHSIFIRTGEYDDGRLGEIFLDMHKEGAAFRSLLNSFAIAVSLGLQYGVPLEEYVDAFTFSRFEPNGMVQGHDYVKMATSVIDFIFRDVAISYLKRTDLAQVKPEDLLSTGTKTDSRNNGNGGAGNGAVKESAGFRPHTPREEANTDADSASNNVPDDRGLVDLGRAGEKASAGQSSGSGSGSRPKIEEEQAIKIAQARVKGYEGDPCPVCGFFTLVRNGTCLKCDTCGSTTGCS